MNIVTRNSLLFAGTSLLLLSPAACVPALPEDVPQEAADGYAPAPERHTGAQGSLMNETPVQPSPTPTIEAAAPQGCGWQWNRQSLPELSAQILADLEQAGQQPQSVLAYAYGEDCIDPQTLEVRHFSAMETSFRISLLVPALEDRDALGEQLRSTLHILQAYPPGTTPGPQPGQVDITFVDGTGETSLHFDLLEGYQSLQMNPGNTGLLDMLGSQP